MKRYICVLILLTFSIVAHGQDAAAPAEQPATQPTTQPAYIDDVSYGVGFSFGQQIKQSPIALNIEQLFAGIRDSAAGQQPRVAEPAFRAAMEQLSAASQAKQKEQGEKSAKAGEAYRAENAKKEGVKTTASGLQIETTKEGTGETPKMGDEVKVHYTGTLIDGTKFDSSVDRGQPATFNLGGVIKGWGEGLQLMKVGGKAKLVVPPDIGYGAAGNGPIPPNSTLIFDVELLEIVKPQSHGDHQEHPQQPQQPPQPQ